MSVLEARLDWRGAAASHSDRLIVDARACQGDGRWLRAAEALYGGRRRVGPGGGGERQRDAGDEGEWASAHRSAP